MLEESDCDAMPHNFSMYFSLATDVTFEYEMNKHLNNYNLYPTNMLKGIFSTTAYQPKLTVYDPVDITL